MRALVITTAAIVFVASNATARADDKIPLTDPNPAPATLKVTIDDAPTGVLGNKHVFKGFGCLGENQSPALHWSGAPKDTQSYVVIVHDPDAPTGVGFFHWVVANIPKSASSLSTNASAIGLPVPAVQGHTDFGVAKYGGPCPPPGAPHRYVFTVYALKVPKLDVDAKATGALVRFLVHDAALAYGRAVATYGR